MAYECFEAFLRKRNSGKPCAPHKGGKLAFSHYRGGGVLRRIGKEEAGGLRAQSQPHVSYWNNVRKLF